MDSNIESQLLQWKSEIEESKTEKSRLEGQKTELLRRLKSDFSCDTLEEAEKRAKAIQDNINKMESQLEKGIEEYKEKYA